MQMPNKSVAVRKLKGVAVSEAVEIVLVAGVLLGFTIFLMSYATAGWGPTMYSKEQQAPQINLAQQALDRVVLLNSPIAVRSGQSWRIVDLALAAPGPLYQPQLLLRGGRPAVHHTAKGFCRRHWNKPGGFGRLRLTEAGCWIVEFRLRKHLEELLWP